MFGAAFFKNDRICCGGSCFLFRLTCTRMCMQKLKRWNISNHIYFGCHFSRRLWVTLALFGALGFWNVSVEKKEEFKMKPQQDIFGNAKWCFCFCSRIYFIFPLCFGILMRSAWLQYERTAHIKSALLFICIYYSLSRWTHFGRASFSSGVKPASK